jgi:hypothetical protein
MGRRVVYRKSAGDQKEKDTAPWRLFYLQRAELQDGDAKITLPLKGKYTINRVG